MITASFRSALSRRLAQLLVSEGLLMDHQAAELYQEATSTDVPLAALLAGRGIVGAEVLLSSLSKLTGLASVDLATERPQLDAAQLVPEDVAREYCAIGYRRSGDRLVAAFAEPPEPDDIRSLSMATGWEILAVLADPVLIGHYIPAIYPTGTPSPSALNRPELPLSAQPQYSFPGRQPKQATSTSPTPSGANPNWPALADTAAPCEQALRPLGQAQQIGQAQHNGHGAPKDGPAHIDDLLRYAVEVGASDLHLTANMPPTIRVNGAILPIEGGMPLDNNDIREMIFTVLPQSQRERFEADKELDTSHSIAGLGRFRMNVFLQRGTVAAAVRPIPHEIPAFSSLGLPESVRDLAELRTGLVLVTGPTGSGKSTSLASLVDIINSTKPLHIVTIEDPIEFLHHHKHSIVNQREIGQDTTSFSEALRRVLRQDPDVILVGEMRDLETIATALTAAETGHLVFGTLHTQDAPQTIDRIIDVFPTSQQDQIRVQLAASLQAVVTQQLVLRADGSGRVVCAEVMMGTSGIRNLIRGAKTHQIYSLMQTGASFGMQTMDQGLARLVKEKVISETVAFSRCRNEEDLRNHLSSVL